MTSLALTADDVREIARQLAPHIRRTPLIEAPGGGFLKLELMQPTGSFKVRGFFNAANAIDPERIARGLLSVSAGNAALACAYVAHAFHVPCRVVMYENAPAPKIDGVRALGAEPVLLPRDGVVEWLAREAGKASRRCSCTRLPMPMSSAVTHRSFLRSSTTVRMWNACSCLWAAGG